ncbi:hypothetical protein N7447_000861 [Penicillium robsamsonii]|uniref:uncharacterized protein n=1 Tax=Penicillium robsamsonii TaxID=1792511 RepID=UPI0025498A9B|nr:uncharacterized protein N7447_000861 [Penicillium robsamsonii]KAJ5834835.1 hypothetical protein N7447_000861 [Penicillium robsamsonii]
MASGQPADPTPEVDHQLLQKAKSPLSSRVWRSGYVLWLVLFYATQVLFVWIMICFLSYHPVTTPHYGYWVSDKKSDFSYDKGDGLSYRNDERHVNLHLNLISSHYYIIYPPHNKWL